MTPSTLSIVLEGLQPSFYTIVNTYVVGRTFETSPIISALETPVIGVVGKGFTSAPTIQSGATARGSSFASTLSVTYSTDNTAHVTGVQFSTNLVASVLTSENVSVIGRGFHTGPILLGAASVAGVGFTTSPAVGGVSSSKAIVTGATFSTSAVISGVMPEIATVVGTGFASGLYYSRIVGGAFSTTPVIQTEFTAEYAEAYVMNIKTNAVSRYQNFPFTHVGRIGDKYYGFDAVGIYELTGTTDTDVEVNGTIHTATLDFGVFNSKNVPYMYVNGDDEYTITGYVDDEEQPPFISGFSGRRVKLARGNKGRYWAFKIEGVSKLQGLEFMPDQLSRRVK